MGGMLSHQVQKVLRNLSPSARPWNVSRTINTVFEAPTLETLAEQLSSQCSSHNLCQ
jgi:hypothetical protein